MRRLTLGLLITFLATGAFAHGRNMSFTNDDERFGDCSTNRITFDDEKAFMERQEIPASGLRALKVRSGNGPVSVRGGNAWSIVACKAAESQALLREIDVRLSGDELSYSGPRERDWVVVYYITAPRGADLTVDASNGPVSLRDVDGRLDVRTKNGPLSLDNLSGRIDAVATNGPVNIHGGSGEMKVNTSNGPLSVKLDGNAFNGTLDASTKNGPLSVRIPRNYSSGVLVESLGHGPISCRAESCRGARARAIQSSSNDDWNDDEPRSFSFGSGTQTVRLSTTNGPLTIRESED